MKVTMEHRKHIQNVLDAFVAANKEKCIAHAGSGLSEKRIYWDFANAAGLNRFICDELYKYCNDEHVDTALKYAYRNIWL